MSKNKEIIGVEYNSLAYGSKIIGQIISDKNVRIDGEIEGEIISIGKIIIGEKGHLKGKAQCAQAEISGEVEGKIYASDTLILRETAVITGDIQAKTLIIDSKAVFNGTCSMNSENVNQIDLKNAELKSNKHKENNINPIERKGEKIKLG